MQPKAGTRGLACAPWLSCWLGAPGPGFGLELPKQLIKIAGKPIIEHTIAALSASPLIDEIIVMMAPGHLDAVRAIVRDRAYPKVTQILEGAGTRNDTTRAALAALGDEDCHVVLHDAVRPLVSQTIIAANIEALDKYDAVDTAIPSPDTVIQVHPDADEIVDVPPRHLLRRGQTPQSFRLSVLREAYQMAGQDPDFSATDDCTVVLRYLPDVPVAVVAGHEQNMKVTEPIDVFIADKLFQLASTEAPHGPADSEYRRLLEGRTMVIFGGSYGIGREIAALAETHGATVVPFSRSGTGTHVESRADVAAAAAEVMAQTGRVDFVVSTAGVLPRGSLVGTSEETVHHAVEVNYLAPIFIAQEFHPHLAASRGSLLLFTSSSYTRGRADYALYSSAKAAVVNLTQALADEWAADGVRVNCVNPERTATPMRQAAFGDEPPGTLLTAAEVAHQSMDILVSELTGHIIDVRRGSAAEAGWSWGQTGRGIVSRGPT